VISCGINIINTTKDQNCIRAYLSKLQWRKTSGEILKFILREFGFEFITIIRVIKSNLIFKSLETVMKATKTELESAVVAVIFNDEDSKRVNLDESGLL
jgi:hypothetical protein